MSAPEYQFYTDVFMGISIPAEDWPRLSSKAADKYAYFDRTYTITGTEEGVNKAICAVADALYTYEVASAASFPVDERGNFSTTRVSIGSVSTSSSGVNFADLGIDFTESGQRKQLYSVIGEYVDIYRGVGWRCGR